MQKWPTLEGRLNSAPKSEKQALLQLKSSIGLNEFGEKRLNFLINMKKKIYCINIMDDFGELWLDNDKKPLGFVHCNDANFRKEYQEFIINYLGGELIEKSIYIDNEKLINKLYDNSGDEVAIAKILKKEIQNL